jgi:hypothetical protein
VVGMRRSGMIGAVNRPLARLACPIAAVALLAGCGTPDWPMVIPASSGPPVVMPTTAGPTATGPTATGPTATGPTAGGATVTDPANGPGTADNPGTTNRPGTTSGPGTANGPGTTNGSAATSCPGSGVRLEAGEIDAAMGLRALGITLVNCGGKTFRLSGYPVTHVLDNQRATIAIRVLNGVTEIAGPIPSSSGPPKPFTLKPGERATTVVVWRNTYDDITHPPVDAPYLEMAPAAGEPAQIVTVQDGLDLGSTGRLGVSPWRPSPKS